MFEHSSKNPDHEGNYAIFDKLRKRLDPKSHKKCKCINFAKEVRGFQQKLNGLYQPESEFKDTFDEMKKTVFLKPQRIEETQGESIFDDFEKLLKASSQKPKQKLDKNKQLKMSPFEINSMMGNLRAYARGDRSKPRDIISQRIKGESCLRASRTQF